MKGRTRVSRQMCHARIAASISWAVGIVAVLSVAMLISLGSTPAMAHHIMGIPHYAYDEQYPQTPILTYVAELGPHELRMTGYPGIPNPGERCTIHVYIVELEGGAPFAGSVTLTAFRDRMLAQDQRIYGPIRAELEERVHKFYPEFADEANYYLRLEYEVEGVPWIIDLPMVVGEPGSPWLTLGLTVGGLVLFVVVIRAIRIKRRRAERRSRDGDPIGPPGDTDYQAKPSAEVAVP